MSAVAPGDQVANGGGIALNIETFKLFKQTGKLELPPGTKWTITPRPFELVVSTKRSDLEGTTVVFRGFNLLREDPLIVEKQVAPLTALEDFPSIAKEINEKLGRSITQIRKKSG